MRSFQHVFLADLVQSGWKSWHHLDEGQKDFVSKFISVRIMFLPWFQSVCYMFGNGLRAVLAKTRLQHFVRYHFLKWNTFDKKSKNDIIKLTKAMNKYNEKLIKYTKQPRTTYVIFDEPSYLHYKINQHLEKKSITNSKM